MTTGAVSLRDDEDDINERLPLVKDAATQKALDKLDRELRAFEYRSKLDLKAALDKNHGSYRQARRYLRWQELALQEKAVQRAEKEEGEKMRRAVELRKLHLAPTYGKPTLGNPVQELLEGRTKSYKDHEVTEKAICADVPQRRLILENRGLSELPEFMRTNFALQVLKPRSVTIARNKLKRLISGTTPGLSVRHFKSVTTLNLIANELCELPPDFGLLTSVRTLILDYNNLHVLPDSITQLKLMAHLSVQHNNLQRLPSHFGELCYLRHLNLNFNTLSELPPSFSGLTSLTLLDLSENKFQHLAILPDPRMQLWGRRTSPLDWVAVPMEGDGSVVRWFNRVTGAVVKQKPSVVKEMEDDEAEPKEVEVKGADGTVKKKKRMCTDEEVLRRRKLCSLAKRGAREWEMQMDLLGGHITYHNCITGESSAFVPPELDTVGALSKLVVFKVNDNQLRALPDSMARMTELEVVECKGNYLKKLPACIKHWTKVRRMIFTENDIVFIANVMQNLTALEELHLTNNVLPQLPDTLGQCLKLSKLMLGNNQLTALPYSFGFLSNLKELQLFGNPMVDPPMEAVAGGRAELLWLLRKKHLEIQRGSPPKMDVHRSGIAGEIITLKPAFDKEIKGRIQRMVKTTDGPHMVETVDLHNQGLRSLPFILLERTGLKQLNLAFNDLGGAQIVFPHHFSSLTELSLWKCGLTLLDPSIGHLTSLKTLNLEENKLRDLPDTVVKLKALTQLRASQNTLCMLPKRFGVLHSLTDLNLECNVLESLPETFSRLTNLKRLSLARNRLFAIDDFIVGLANLETLNLANNHITFLPDGFGRLKCKTVLLSFNRIEYLDEKFIDPNLCTTLSTLHVAWNNLLELPLNFFECSNLKELTYECNPLKSPPIELLAEDLTSIYKYGKLRQVRLTEIPNLLYQARFLFNATNLTPTTEGLVTGNTGFLLPEDLRDFDEVVDEYVNGKFYRCNYTGEELVDKLAKLRDERNYCFNKTLLDAVLRVIEQELPEDLYGAGVLVDEVCRPWGRDGEVVKCYGLSLQALLHDRPRFYDDDIFRPSLYSRVVESLPKQVFPYDHAALRNAVQKFKHAYGRVAYFETIEYPMCECQESSTGDYLNHIPCRLPSLVILRTIYSREEAERRQHEQDEMFALFKKVQDKVREYAKTKEGKKKAQEELRYRRERHQGAILSRESKAQLVRQQITLLEAELASVRKRETAFVQGQTFDLHGINSEEEVNKMLSDAEAAITKCENQVADIQDEIRALERERSMTNIELTNKTWTETIHKYCYFEAEKHLFIARRLAYHNRLRRPWDGEDGVTFIKWMEHRRHPDLPLDWQKVLMEIDRLEGSRRGYDDDEEEEQDEPQMDWKDCENMNQYKNSYVDMWLAKNKSFLEATFENLERLRSRLRQIGVL